jgi:integrase/recombinase XerC
MRYSLNKNKYLLDHEASALEYLLKRHQEDDARNCLLIWTGLRTGARAQEILNLKVHDLSHYDQTIFIKGLKGSNDREIPVAKDFFRRLELLANTLGNSEQLFDISYQRLYQIWDVYRPCRKTFHSLRHTFAINLYKKTKDIRLVQVALGHRNINNTMVYADYVYSKEELKKLIL